MSYYAGIILGQVSKTIKYFFLVRSASIAFRSDTYLPADLSALSETSSTERVTLGDQTTARINDVFATVSELTLIDELASLTRRTQAQSLVVDQLYYKSILAYVNNSKKSSRVRR